MKKIVLIMLSMVAFQQANATTYYWRGTLNWTSPTSWSLLQGGLSAGAVPGANDDAVILTTTSTTVSLGSVNIVVASLTCAGNVSFTNNSSGTLRLTAGTVDIGGGTTVLNSGGSNITLVVGSITTTGTLDMANAAVSSRSDMEIESSFNGSVTRSSSNVLHSNINFKVASATFSGSVSSSAAGGVDFSITQDMILNSDVNVPGNVTIAPNKKLYTQGKQLRVKGNVVGGNQNNFVVLDGGGSLTIAGIGDNRAIAVSPFFIEGGKLFPIGEISSSYDPVYIYNDQGTGVTADFKVSVANRTPFGCSNPNGTFEREWNITSSSTAANLEFEPNPTSGPFVGLPPNPVVGHYTGGVWTEKPSAPNMDLGYGLKYGARFTSFSPFAVGQAGSLLPVELVAFNATKANKANLLTWKTASEKNNSHFDVERSMNGENNWTTIGSVKGKGTSTLANNYSFNDNTPLSISYYRLKQMDFDGKAEYSKVVSVVDGKADKFKITSVSPNPFKDVATIVFDSNKEDNITVTLTDVTGRVVLLKNVACTEGGNLLNLNTAALSCGIYIVGLRNSDGFVVQKIIKD